MTDDHPPLSIVPMRPGQKLFIAEGRGRKPPTSDRMRRLAEMAGLKVVDPSPGRERARGLRPLSVIMDEAVQWIGQDPGEGTVETAAVTVLEPPVTGLEEARAVATWERAIATWRLLGYAARDWDELTDDEHQRWIGSLRDRG